MTAFGGIIGLLVHTGLIYFGVRMADVERAGFWQSLAVALISYIIMYVLKLLLFFPMLLPLIGSLLGALVLLFATALAARLVLDIDWKPAWTIGIVVAVANAVLSLLFH